MAIIHSYQFLVDLCKALHLEGPITKVVIEIPVDDVVKIYITRLLDNSQAQPFIDTLTSCNPDIVHKIEVADVDVSDCGEVRYREHLE